MNSKRLFFGLIAILGLLAVGTLAIGYAANSVLTAQSQTLIGVKAQSAALSAQELQLNKNKKDITTYSELNKIAQSIVPQDKDQAEAVREIVNLAAQSGIGRLTSITFPASTLGIGVGGTTTTRSTGLTQVTPVKGIAGVFDLQITVTQDTTSRVSYAAFTAFLGNLEKDRRTAQVSSISVQPDPKQPDQVAFTLIIDEFIKP